MQISDMARYRLLSLLALLLLGLVSCGEPTFTELHFIVPDGYHGAFTIVIDPVKGIDIPEEERKYVYHIPKDGILTVRENLPEMKYLRYTCAYENGEAIPVSYVTHMYPADKITMFGPQIQQFVDGRQYLFLIGTEKELKDGKDQYLKDKKKKLPGYLE